MSRTPQTLRIPVPIVNRRGSTFIASSSTCCRNAGWLDALRCFSFANATYSHSFVDGRRAPRSLQYAAAPNQDTCVAGMVALDVALLENVGASRGFLFANARNCFCETGTESI